MAFIKFNKSSTKAAATSTAAKTDNTVYFPTDEKAIYLNGQKYGENLGLTQTPAQVQTLLDKVEGMVFVDCSSLPSYSDKTLPDSVKLVAGNFIVVRFINGNTNYAPYLVAGSYKKRVTGYTDWDQYAKVIFYIGSDYAFVVNSVIEGKTAVPLGGDTRLITSGGVFSYSVPRLSISVNNYIGDTNTTEDVVSQSINMEDDTEVNTWRTLIKRGASPRIVISLDDDEETLYINSVYVRDTWYPGDAGSNYLTLSFYLEGRYINLTFYAPSDDPGGGS
jgi:hypothetical protein